MLEQGACLEASDALGIEFASDVFSVYSEFSSTH